MASHAYASARGHALLDGELYLPKEWTEDPKRRAMAGVPGSATLQTKGDLALTLLARAAHCGHLQGQWVTGDCVYGSDGGLRDGLEQGGFYYVLEVRQNERVFTGTVRPQTAVPAWSGHGHGRKPERERLVLGSVAAQSVGEIALAVPPKAWRSLTVAEGAQGERRYQFFRLRVWECRSDLPGRECWLLLRRRLDGTDLKYCLSSAPLTTPLLLMGQVGAMRWHDAVAYRNRV
jgi:SRSO17 transposase